MPNYFFRVVLQDGELIFLSCCAAFIRNSTLCTLGTTAAPNRWDWLHKKVLVEGSLVDTFRHFSPNCQAYTRYPSKFLTSGTRLDMIFISKDMLRLDDLQLQHAGINYTDQTSDHHPISATLTLPLLPSEAGSQVGSTLFRRLTLEEVRTYQGLNPT